MSTQSAVKECIPPSLRKELQNLDIDFDSVHAILMTNTSDVRGATAAALIVGLKSLNILDIMKKAGFLDWSLPSALGVLEQCHRLSTVVSPDFFSSFIPSMRSIISNAVAEYKFFCGLFCFVELDKATDSRHLLAIWKLALIALNQSIATSHEQASIVAVEYACKFFNTGRTTGKVSQEDEAIIALTKLISSVASGDVGDERFLKSIDRLYTEHVPTKDGPLDLSLLAVDENVDYFLSEDNVSPIYQGEKGSLPIIYSDAMELSEWIIATAFREQVPVPKEEVDGKYVERCMQNLIEDAQVVIPSSGFVKVRQFGDSEVAKAIIAVYFSIMEIDEAMTIATTVVLKAMSTNSRLHKNIPEIQLYKILEATECNTVALLNSIDDVKPQLPRLLRAELSNVEINVMDSLVWIRDGPLSELIECLPDGFWPPPSLCPDSASAMESSRDWAMICCVFSKVTNMIKERLIGFVKLLGLDSYMFIPIFETCRYCLRERMNLVWDRHIDHIVLCSVYGVCRACEIKVMFADILDVYVRLREHFLGAATCNRIARHIVIDNQVGNIITFYNKVFVPELKTYLLKDPILKKFADKRKSVQPMET